MKKEDTLASKEEGMKYSDAMVFQLINLELRNYFYRMNDFLQDKKYSHCTREIVLLEIRRCFYFFQKFIALLRRK